MSAVRMNTGVIELARVWGKKKKTTHGEYSMNGKLNLTDNSEIHT